ncbi:hypothetical protein H8E88_00510 [candidate division KSB1 bacterium]|nr:hypothetical protein [candidate division KSB1 bacterium]
MELYSGHRPNKLIFWGLVIIGLFFIGVTSIGFEFWMKTGERPVVEFIKGILDKSTVGVIIWSVFLFFVMTLMGSITCFILSFLTYGVFLLIGKFDKELNITVSDNQIDKSIKDTIIRTVVMTVFSVLIIFSIYINIFNPPHLIE